MKSERENESNKIKNKKYDHWNKDQQLDERCESGVSQRSSVRFFTAEVDLKCIMRSDH